MPTPNAIVLTTSLLLSYLLGAVPFALVLGRLKGVDIRRHGSGNIGATNLTRVLGRRWGIAAFALDFGKGLAPALGMKMLAGDVLPVEPLLGVHAAMLCGLAAVLGHVFPVFLRFRGGKGVATTFGVMTALLPLAAAIAGACWGIVFLVSRTVSIASIVAAVAFPVAVAVLGSAERAVYWSELGLASSAAILIVVRHHSNIRRLLGGQENRF